MKHRRCDDRCLYAQSPECSCACGGKNHQMGPALDRQANQARRAELLALGIEEQGGEPIGGTAVLGPRPARRPSVALVRPGHSTDPHAADATQETLW